MLTEFQEAKLKEAIHQEYMNANACGQAKVGYQDKCCDEPKREGLRARIEHRRYQAEKETRKAMALAELGHLLDKHPDFARILELMEEVGR